MPAYQICFISLDEAQSDRLLNMIPPYGYQATTFQDEGAFFEAFANQSMVYPDLIFIGEKLSDHSVRELSEWIDSRKVEYKQSARPTLFLLTSDDAVGPLFSEGIIDDYLSVPIKEIDFASKIRMGLILKEWRAYGDLEKEMRQIESAFSEDVKKMAMIQKRLLPKRFPDISDLEIDAKYWVGESSGGNYYDVINIPEKKKIAFLLTDVNGYRLSSVLMTILVKVGIHQNLEALQDSPVSLVQGIFSELKEVMKDRDRFSVFFACLDQRTYQMQYCLNGSILGRRFHQDRNKTRLFAEDFIQSGALSNKSSKNEIKLQSINVKPSDRLIFASQGAYRYLDPQVPALESQLKSLVSQGDKNLSAVKRQIQEDLRRHEASSIKAFNAISEKYFQKSSTDFFNALFFQIQQSGPRKEGRLPLEDCAAFLIDVNDHILRLAPGSS
jgi:serine phosphatase RsbU (regulator of sigma subunit)